MKRLSVLLSFILIFSLVLCPSASAQDNFDTLADWEIRVAVPDEAAAAVLQGNSYYIYAQQEGYIPYVMLMATSRFASEEEFIDYLNEAMASQYRSQGFQIASPAELRTVGSKLCYEVDYSYTISGYDAVDRRIFMTVGDLTYMFASKEVPSLGMTLGTMLEDVVAGCVFLAEEPALPENTPSPGEGDDSGLCDAYLYCQDDGMPKYWLDLTGAIIDKPVLHCYFRSGDPTFYESCFILDFDPQELEDNGGVFVSGISNVQGTDVSDWFKWFSVELDEDGILFDIERDEKTLAGGPEDNIMTGVYLLEPSAAAVSYEYRDDSGALKYWLVDAGETVELHGSLRSGGDPESFEEIYVLDGASAEDDSGYVTSYSKILKKGSDVSRWFQSVVLSRVQNSYILSVERDEKTLAGGPDDNILTGVYTFDPHVCFTPLEDGPFTEEELGVLAKRYYFRNHGFFPPEAEVAVNEDGSFTVHLFEIVDLDGTTHTATSAWYTVDPFGVGVNDITGEEVYLAD